MKKLQKLMLVLLIVISGATMLSACATTSGRFSPDKVQSVYTNAGFTVSAMTSYDGLDFSTMNNVDKAFLVTKDKNSALVVVYNIPGEK